MFGIKRIVIAQHERALYLKNRTITKVLEPGVYWMFDLLGRIEIQVYDITEAEFNHPNQELIVKEHKELCDRYFHVAELGDHEVAYLYVDNKLTDVLFPATRHLYWKGPFDIRVDIQNIEQDYQVQMDKMHLLAHKRLKSLGNAVVDAVLPVEVSARHVGLLFIDGELVDTLQPGLYVFWKFNRKIKVEQVDTRLQAMEVSGQEILTRDKVSLRVNVSAAYKIVDPVTARNALVNMAEYLYREVQFAIREAIGTRLLDELLGNKGELDRVIFESVKSKAEENGIHVQGVGVKDIILPGDMKDIMNQVVQAEKAAQANVIKRREETAATRSLLNTARLMDENPTLLRLKELEALEKVTEKIDKLTVFGGLDGVLKEVVKVGLG
jgi:regulator of protease activity HflC (stomatin/prohibitin superfamily)